MKNLEWVSNVTDPHKPVTGLVTPRIGQTHAEAEREFLAWATKFHIDKPRATPTHSVKRLVEMGMVGLYRKAKP